MHRYALMQFQPSFKDVACIGEQAANMNAQHWVPELEHAELPQYIAIAEAIKLDIASGRLSPGDRLPPQRQMAQSLGLDVSSISRGYAEAARRGYVKAHVGRGTFVSDPASDEPTVDPRRNLEEDPRMNMPPEPDDPVLIAKMQAGLAHVSANIVPLLRYQTAIGSTKDREIASLWIAQNGLSCSMDTLAITPGAHAAIEAALRVLRQPQTVILCEAITYPGIRTIAAGLDLKLIGLEEDPHGVTPDALKAALKTHPDAVLYLNPTLRNPTTQTMPAQRRREIAAILDAHKVPLIEDDAYRFVTDHAPQPLASYVPHLAWHVMGVSKVFGAGLRLAFTHIPGPALSGAFVKAIRTGQVMASPLSLALLSTWLDDGTASEIQAFVRAEAIQRQQVAAECLCGFDVNADPVAFNTWINLPEGFSRAEVLSRMSKSPMGLMPSDVFTVLGDAPEALRVCLGGPIPTNSLRRELLTLKEVLLNSEWIA